MSNLLTTIFGVTCLTPMRVESASRLLASSESIPQPHGNKCHQRKQRSQGEAGAEAHESSFFKCELLGLAVVVGCPCNCHRQTSRRHFLPMESRCNRLFRQNVNGPV